MPAPFAAWLKFEPDEARKSALLQEAFVDGMLAHQVFQIPPTGLSPMQARQIMLDDDKLLLPTGRRLWNAELLNEPGMLGKFCYLHSSFCLKRLFSVQFFIDGKPVTVYDNQYRIERSPSHTLVRYTLGPLDIDEYKYLTDDDRAVCTYQVSATDNKAHQLDLEVLAPYLPMPSANPGASR